MRHELCRKRETETARQNTNQTGTQDCQKDRAREALQRQKHKDKEIETAKKETKMEIETDRALTRSIAVQADDSSLPRIQVGINAEGDEVVANVACASMVGAADGCAACPSGGHPIGGPIDEVASGQAVHNRRLGS